MAGAIIFDPDNDELSLATSDVIALGTFLEISTNHLYLTDGSDIKQWDLNNSALIYDWKSGIIRLKSPVNLAAAVVEAVTYVDVVFKLYADIGGTMTLKHTQTVLSDEPFRLPGGYLSHLYSFQLTGTDVITRVACAENIFELDGAG